MSRTDLILERVELSRPQAKHPLSGAWVEIYTEVSDARAWMSGDLRVISSVDDGEFHVSASRLGDGGVPEPPSDAEMTRIRTQFGMTSAEEDSTAVSRARARHLWLSVP